MTDMNPMRRMRVTYDSRHHPPVWAAYYEPPGRTACYCHAPGLDEMFAELGHYFAENGEIQPLRVEDRFMKYLRPIQRNVGLTGNAGEGINITRSLNKQNPAIACQR